MADPFPSTTDRQPPPSNPYRGLVVAVCLALALGGGVALLLAWRLNARRRPPLVSAASTPDADPEVRALLDRLDRELRLPTTRIHPPLELLKEHDAEFARRRLTEVIAAKTALASSELPADAPEELRQAIRRELAALNGEQRALNRLARYDDEPGRQAAHDNYRKRRVEVFLARRTRSRLEKREAHATTSRTAGSRRRARDLRLLKELDRRYVDACTAALDAYVDVLRELHSRVDYRDPLYLLYNDQIRALRRERVWLGRLTLYHGVADRMKPRERLARARRDSLNSELAVLHERQRRLPADSPLFWGYDRLVALLQQFVARPAPVLAHATPEAALVELATSLRRERPLVDARRRYATALANASPVPQTASLFRRWAAALGRQLDALDALAREAKHAAESSP